MNTEIIGIPITFIILSAAVLWLIILGKGYWWLKAFIVAVVLYFSLAMWFSLTNFSGWPVDIDMPNKFLVHWALVKQPSKKDVYQQGSILIWATEVDENNETIVQQNKTLITPFTRSEKAVEPRVYKIPYSEKMHQKLIDAMKQITQGKQIIGENKYFINQNTTFYLAGKGSISSVFNFESNQSTTIFNIGENYSSPINQCQGDQYFGKSGAISINVETSNIRKCTVLFNVVY